MPQYRKLHTKILESHDFNELPDDFARLLWVLLPLGLDSAGRGIDKPSWVRSKIMPLREDVTDAQIESALASFAAAGMIARYAHHGHRYFCVPKWTTYQTGTDRESPSHLPGIDDPDSTQELLKSNSRPTQEFVSTNSPPYSDSDSDADANAEEGADAPPPKHPRKAVKSELLSHPAVIAYRDKMLVTPTPAARQAMAAKVTDFDLWGKVLTDWATNSYNPQNVAGLLDAYAKGGVNGRNGHRNGSSVVRGTPAARKPAAFNVKDARTAGE